MTKTLARSSRLASSKKGHVVQPMPPRVRIIEAFCDGLTSSARIIVPHTPEIHRDVKPSNVRAGEAVRASFERAWRDLRSRG